LKVVVTGATGTIGQAIVSALRARGDEVAILSRNPDTPGAHTWSDPENEPAPAAAFDGADAVVHLAGEPVEALE
jgi:uncharacterized protein YbjT (DUF2867 family)